MSDRIKSETSQVELNQVIDAYCHEIEFGDEFDLASIIQLAEYEVALDRGLNRIDDPLQLVRKRELARLLSVDSWTIDNWRKSGRIPQPIVLSPQIVAWRRRDIERWLREREDALSYNYGRYGR